MSLRQWIWVGVVSAAMACSGRAATDRAVGLLPRTAGTLYHRLGGYDALAAMTDDFLRRMLGDRELAVFFEELSVPEQNRVRQMLVDQLCEATGGPCVYVGQDMQTAHQGLGITAPDWDRAVAHLVATLTLFQVPQQDRQELLRVVAGMRDQIVQPEGSS